MKTILLGNNSTICFFVENPNVVHCQNELESLVKLSVRVHLFCTSLPRFDFGEAVIVHQILMDSNGLPSSKLLHSAVMLLQDQFLAPFNLAYWIGNPYTKSPIEECLQKGVCNRKYCPRLKTWRAANAFVLVRRLVFEPSFAS